jgi:hypothetical protein
MGSLLIALASGYSMGTGWIFGDYNRTSSLWRVNLASKIRATRTFKTFVDPLAGRFFTTTEALPDYNTEETVGGALNMIGRAFFLGSSWLLSTQPESVAVRPVYSDILKRNPSHPYIFAVLREAIVREKGGYVHPDLGFLEPAPCGAARGIGMVRNLYHNCQSKCMPGLANEKLQLKRALKAASKNGTSLDDSSKVEKRYMQEEILIKVPLSFQMTRKVALDTLLPLIPADVQRKASMHELDDAALLVLSLAHERGVGTYSRWLPYIASLPTEPSCGYSVHLRPYVLDSINAMRNELGMDVNGWPSEMLKATQYAEKIAKALAKDYGAHIEHPKGVSAEENIQWALCQVASRATAGTQKYGALRMIPLLDMVNHDAAAGGFVELIGTERLEEGDFIDATEDEDLGAFVVRSLRHGQRKALRPGQELLVNYNVPHYAALDWFVSLGFVPPERYQNWQKLDSPLPRIRQDGPFSGLHEEGNTGGRRVFPDYS